MTRKPMRISEAVLLLVAPFAFVGCNQTGGPPSSCSAQDSSVSSRVACAGPEATKRPAEVAWQSQVDAILVDFALRDKARDKYEIARVRLESLLAGSAPDYAASIYLFLGRLNACVRDLGRASYYFRLAYEADLSRIEAGCSLLETEYDGKRLHWADRKEMELTARAIREDLPYVRWADRVFEEIQSYAKDNENATFYLSNPTSFHPRRGDSYLSSAACEQLAHENLKEGKYEIAARAALCSVYCDEGMVVKYPGTWKRIGLLLVGEVFERWADAAHEADRNDSQLCLGLYRKALFHLRLVLFQSPLCYNEKRYAEVQEDLKRIESKMETVYWFSHLEERNSSQK